MLSKTKVKYIQSLGQKKFRQSEGMFLAEGPKLVTELLQEVPQKVQEVYATADWIAESGDLLKQVNCVSVDEAMLEKISLLSTPNKVVALVKQFEAADNIELKNHPSRRICAKTFCSPGAMGFNCSDQPRGPTWPVGSK